MSDYLHRLPPALRRLGDWRKGEIEIVDSPALPGADADAFGVLYEDPYFLVVRDAVRHPDGRLGAYVRIIERGELSGCAGTVILPLAGERLGFVRLYRHAMRDWRWELPRGMQASGLTPEQNARQELQEEMGLVADSCRYLGRVESNTGFLSASIQVFLAKLPAESAQRTCPSLAEAIAETRFVHLADLPTFLAEHVVCGITLSAICLAQKHWLTPP